ncbi:hypothetical protein [Metapseudomonas otitidis]|uniref:hypothetical protein n=1 Tax=Metapseudomonas otitidis TaxID=319939 RepID=UPI0020975260|nr:hypothetical protein [Pseudomonas otitidis]MCO7556188.1 hypothetical protein [Pseudomonas otitidis]
MSIKLKKDEVASWDEFAKVALEQIMRTNAITGEVAAKTAALFADCLIEERRERTSSTTSVSEML